MKTVRAADGATLAYRLWRPGAPRRLLVLVHGLASNGTRWTEFTATTRLRESWDLLRVDLRGFGESASRARVGPDVWARDIATILDAEGAPGAVVVGHCLGANVALRFGARHPARAEGLVLVEPMFREALTGARRALIAARPFGYAAAAIIRGVNRLGLYRRQLEALDLVKLDTDARAVIAKQGAEAFPEEKYGSAIEDLRSTPTAVYLTGLMSLADPTPDLPRITAPALALLSSGGRFGDPEVTKQMLAKLPRCETRMLPARHWIPTERPVEMRAAIDEWCSTMPA